MDENLKKYHDLVGMNKIFRDRTANVGVLSREQAFEFGATGPVLRGSGIARDLRKATPYGIYEKFDFDVIVGKGEMGTIGDCWDRYYVRMFDMVESLKILKQAVAGIEEGPVMGKVPKIIKLDYKSTTPKKAKKLITKINLMALIITKNFYRK